MNIIDSHCHLDKIDLSYFGGSMKSMLSMANELGVSQFLCVNIDLNNFSNVLKLAENYQQIFASVGIHPTHLMDKEPTIDELITLADHKKIIAIGETGLDYFHIKKEEANWQRERFRTHIEVAKQTKKPLIIHTRDAKKDTMDIIEQEKAEQGIMHCFVEDWATAKRALDCGFYISFSGILTFKNAIDIQEVAKKIPADRLLVETDSPYLTPMPYRGKENMPGYTRYVVEKLAQLRNTTTQEMANISTQNFNRLFFNA
ncbi:Putative deoxyribonuclease YcfH [hydrothermal vent metagenome]|uniref:Putative deoxyribonuclease YcfH n=1 Tax=hydrothermal vent metagenome TaxID=652676 RepID=A0A1W1C4G2_9ZZZZ